MVGLHSSGLHPSLRVLRRKDGERGWREKVIHRISDEDDNWRRVKLIKRFECTRMPFPKIGDIKRTSGEILVVRNFVEGKSLRWHLRLKKEISVFQAIRLYSQLVGQICFLHRKMGIVHGDLSPENMIVSPTGKAISLIDFGSCFAFSDSAKPNAGDGFRELYQAPETLVGTAPSRLTEQFSAASIFYEMLTRKTPFHVVEKRESEIQKELTPASKQPASEKPFPTAIWALVDRHLETALSLKPAGRFQTIDDWQDSAKDLRIKSEHPELLQLELNNRSVMQKLNAWIKSLIR